MNRRLISCLVTLLAIGLLAFFLRGSDESRKGDGSAKHEWSGGKEESRNGEKFRPLISRGTPDFSHEETEKEKEQEGSILLKRGDPIALREKVLRVLGMEEELSLRERIAEIKTLGDRLNAREVEEMLAFLRGVEPPEGMSESHYNWLRNDILGRLIYQKQLDPRVGEAMLEMLAEREHNEVWRDYVVQFFGNYMARTAFNPKVQSEKQYEQMMEAWWGATEETGGTIGGTALMGLQRQMPSDENISEQEVRGRAVAVARNPQASDLSRLTAMQVAANMGAEEILPFLRQEARFGGSLAMRRSAIAALGTLGGQKEAELIAQLMEDGEAVAGLEAAIERSLALIQERQAGGHTHTR